jgi:DTW domain-containing protein YfiP
MDDSDPIDNRLFVLILQHPREKKEALATAALTLAMLRRAALAVGVTWANLGQALGRPADPRRWAVLYLGSARPRAFGRERDLVALDRHGEPEVDQRAALRDLEGAVLLDGSWGEAKALWWRNPWLLKLRRLVLDPQQPSHYNRVRREPRREALSTIEAAALLLSRIDGRPEIEVAMNAALDRLIAETRPRARALGSNIL